MIDSQLMRQIGFPFKTIFIRWLTELFKHLTVPDAFLHTTVFFFFPRVVLVFLVVGVVTDEANWIPLQDVFGRLTELFKF